MRSSYVTKQQRLKGSRYLQYKPVANVLELLEVRTTRNTALQLTALEVKVVVGRTTCTGLLEV